MGDSYNVDRIVKSRLSVGYMSHGDSDTDIVHFNQSVKYRICQNKTPDTAKPNISLDNDNEEPNCIPDS